jgi:hypothetical protein
MLSYRNKKTLAVKIFSTTMIMTITTKTTTTQVWYHKEINFEN